MAKAISHSNLNAELSAFSDAPHWYVAYSGGVDSTALLQLINSWCKANGQAPPLTALHINHGLQAQAADWENHCAWICRFLDVPFLALNVDVDPDATFPGSGL